uniref:Uncharacterized protein n=1 Tax=viral metagenome TaxID=1070528 RepID=A0A6C0LY94_9ZZZZ
MSKIIIFLVIRNESEYLIEWLQYHLALGVDNFIILDDESSDNTFETLKPFIDLNIVHYFKESFGPTSRTQRTKYYNLFKEQYDKSILIFIDIDEFIYIKGNNLKILLGPNFNIINNFMMEDRVYRKTKKNNFNLLNEDIYKFKLGFPHVKKTIIRINKNKIPTFENSHCVWYDEKTFKGVGYDIGYFHIKWLSFQEEQNKVIKYKKINCNSYYSGSRNSTDNGVEKKTIIANLEKKLNKLVIIKKYVKINIYAKNLFKKFYIENGFLFVPNFFDAKKIDIICNEAKNIYKTQMIKLNLINDKNISNIEFEDSIKILFNNHFETFLNCGKQCQHLINLWKLSLDDDLIQFLKILGIKNPHISTRPVLFSNSKHIAKNKINHTVPPQQDWASMQGSINSIVGWIPLVDINQELGSIALVPKSHKEGLLSKEKEGNFGIVNNYKDTDFISFNVKKGDIIFFNSFLVHKSGNNITNNIRWSCHMRYNDLDEKSFIERGYPNAYVYKPIEQILTPNFDTKTEINKYIQRSLNLFS